MWSRLLPGVLAGVPPTLVATEASISVTNATHICAVTHASSYTRGRGGRAGGGWDGPTTTRPPVSDFVQRSNSSTLLRPDQTCVTSEPGLFLAATLMISVLVI